MSQSKDYYSIIGVDKKATEQEIKKAFRKLSIKYHPDKNNGDKAATEKFKEVAEAYDVLGDKNKRQEYDNIASNPFGGFGGARGRGGYGGPNYQDPFSSFDSIRDIFEKFNGGNQEKENHENLNIVLNVNLPLTKVYNNEKITLQYKRFVPCSTCDGQGVQKSEVNSAECLHCDGIGYKNSFGTKLKCKYCNGEGEIHTDPCSKCNGYKVQEKQEKIPITNTSRIGLKDYTLTQEGYGHFSKYYRGTKGNLVVNFVAEISKDYKINGVTLFHDVDVDFQKAILGGEFEYKHLDGKKYNIKVPEKTKDKSTLRMKGAGLLYPSGNQRGDLIFRINLVVDYSKLTSKTIELLKQ